MITEPTTPLTRARRPTPTAAPQAAPSVATHADRADARLTLTVRIGAAALVLGSLAAAFVGWIVTLT